MQYNFNKTCASHMPILLAIINFLHPKKVLEVGSGIFSTSLFVKHCSSFKSIEVGNKAWYSFLRKKMKKDFNYSLAKDYQEAIALISGTYKLIFVDCCNPRFQIVNQCFEHSKNIVLHDSQLHTSKLIVKPDDFMEFTFNKFPLKYKNHRKDAFADRPWTTLFTKDEKVIKYFQSIKEEDLYKTYQFPYGVSK